MGIALGGCVASCPRYGITEDTGGHITYLLGVMQALASRADIQSAEIVTRLFDAPDLGAAHAMPIEIVTDKLRITRIDSGNRQYLGKEALSADRPAFISALLAELRSREKLPDVIHAHFADAADVALAVRDALGIPFIYTPHSLGRDKLSAIGGDSQELAARITEEDNAIGRADAVIGSSRDECERQLAAYPSAREETIRRVCPGIDQTAASESDIAAARALVAPFLRHPERPTILAIARPVAKKNLISLVDAFGKHPTLRDRANLVLLAGKRSSIDTGEDEQVRVIRQLTDAIDKYDLHGHVAYPRSHDQSSVRGLYGLAQESGGVFVNPALTEPFGLTILEAAVHGVPVVATCHGGPVDIVDELQHGVLVEPTDPSSIAAAIVNLLDDRAKWTLASQNGRRNIKNIRWDSYAAQFRRIAASLVSRKTASVSPIRKVPAATAPRTLVLCDIDNTLTGCRPSADRLTRFLNVQRDMVFGIATGRSLIEARRILADWNLPEPQVLVTSVGTEIRHAGTAGLKRDDSFSQSIASGWDVAGVEQVMEAFPQAIPQAGVEQRQFKRSYFLHEAALVGRIREALRDGGVAARVVFSHDRLLDILPAKAGKGAAMRHVARRLSIPLDRVIVAGDSGNDTDMLTACPNAIVVANCEAELRELAGQDGPYMARRSYAAGVLEGLIAYRRKIQKTMAEAA
ncbi:HAD-IIB family hydrolase [Alteripontixanthobacter maritimus]|nr:HAD-IIB family hydrolase [Alteripontixanthobacter maritimus]